MRSGAPVGSDLRRASARLAAVAAGQHGLFTRVQAVAAGYTRYQIRKRVGVGAWSPVLAGVLTAGPVSEDPGLRDRALRLVLPEVVLAGAPWVMRPDSH